MNRKGQSISINTIIVAAIGLAVLIVLFAIFTGRLGIFTQGVQQTDTCKQKCNALNMDNFQNLNQPSTSCPNDETPVAGSYSDGKYGCCCRQKP